jgi:F-type H+-transporting ATPase subunit alpha
LITGLRIVDTVLPIGRGQRELILGDRGTGKTCIVIAVIIHNSRISHLSSVDGFGCRRLFGFYIGLNQNLSKVHQLTILHVID